MHSFVAEPSLYKEKELLVAQGTPAIHGEDAFLEMIYQQQESKTPKESDDGKVDFIRLRIFLM
nr:flagellar assembly protein A [Caldalkalibacillus mannanilyticus]